jgi:hypothetical protein
MENVKKQSLRDGERYRADGDSPLTPSEFLTLRTRLLSSHKIEDFQFWVLLLLSVKLFLRSSEATGDNYDHSQPHLPKTPTGLTIKSIDTSLSVVEDGIIKSLAIVVKGKTDRKECTLMIWRDEARPLLCPIIHLQVYIYLIKLKGRLQ